MWRKICHVEKFQIYMHDRCGEIWNFSTFGVISNFSTWQMWRNLTFLHMLSNFKFFHMTDVEKSEVSPHLASVWCEECLNICERYVLLLKNWFYAVLSRNLFCRDLRTFVWRKIEPKIASVEKKWQISGMDLNTVMSVIFLQGSGRSDDKGKSEGKEALTWFLCKTDSYN